MTIWFVENRSSSSGRGVILLHPPAGDDACCLPVLFPCLKEVQVQVVEDRGDSVLIRARTLAGAAACPRCEVASSRVHSRYRRVLRDLAVSGRSVTVDLEVRRFFCGTVSCEQRIFVEQVDGLTRPRARRTPALTGLLTSIGVALAGRAGARMAARVGTSVGRSTLLRMVRALPDPEVGQVTVLGVDDFAKRRGMSYGTVLVDLDADLGDGCRGHRVVDVLNDREADTLAHWLRGHPEVQIVCRDRAGGYANGASQGAPQARQVADRWHLCDNLGRYVEKTIAAHHRCVKDAWPGSQPPSAQEFDQRAAAAQQAAAKATADHAQNRSRVVRARELHQRIQAMKTDGKNVATITRELGISHTTARKYYRAENVESLVALTLAGWPSTLDDYKPHLHRRWNEGCTNIMELHREITKLGFRSSYATIYAHLAPFKGTAAPPAVTAPPKLRHITSWIRRRPDNLDTDEQRQLADVLTTCPHLVALHAHVKAFAQMMTHRRGTQDLDTWLAAVRDDDLPHLHTFANGIQRDHTAVLNGLSLPYSSGAVEGNVNRIKMLKRQMFGRANFDLLRARILGYN